MRKEKMITKLKALKQFPSSVPWEIGREQYGEQYRQYLGKQVENSMENIHTDIRE